jgi:hypothetical protein
MNALDRFVVSAKIKTIKAKENIKEFLTKEPGDSQVVVALLLIAVAIGLCLIFKNAAKTIMANVAGQVNTAVSNLVQNQVLDEQNTNVITSTETPQSFISLINLLR